ncbi:cadherin domain-containing protein, partial [Gammaproteobacteria bacterium]|nr:cadherin domain-containing protein [Gammaproteobacteria bacterium]
MRFKLTLVSAALLSISLLSYTYDENLYALEKAYSNSQLENLNQDLEDLSRVDIKDRAISLIEEKNIIEEKIEKGELDPENSSSGPIIRLSNIYSELNLIQKILSGAGLFLLIDEIFGDDDGPRIPNISISSSSASESSGTASVSVELSNPFNQEIVLNYSTSDDTAEAASDYTASTGTITFAPSETTKSISLDIIDDGIFEVDETFNVNFTLGATSLGNLVNDTASITINNDDDAPVFGIAGANVKEEGGTASITITKTNPVQMDITVNYATADGTALAGLDYVAVNDSVTFAANETEKTISVLITEDSLDEDEESFSLSLTGASQGAVQETESVAIVSIEDNDDAPRIRISGSNNIVEGDTLNINVTLAAESGKTVSVNLQNTDVQAIAGEDFNALNETVTFAPGETSKVVTLSTIDDAIDEIDEVFSVIALSPVNTVIASSDSAPNGVLSVLIEDNDDASVISLPANFNVAESVGAVAVDVTLDKASGRTISVNYATSSDNSSSSAFEASSGVLTFEPGETTKSVNITVNDNEVFSENTNSFTLTLSNASNGTISDGSSSTLVTIDDNETLPTVSVADITVREGQNPSETAFTIVLSGPQDTDRSLFVGATKTGDIDERVETIIIPAQSLSYVQEMFITDDNVYEETETFVFEVYESYSGAGPIASATATILDNDPAPVLSFSSDTSQLTIDENSSKDLTVVLVGASALDTSFDIEITNQSASDEDYSVSSLTYTIPAGNNSTIISVDALADAVDEFDERLLVSLTNINNATVGSLSSSLITIADTNDTPTLTTSSQAITVNEGDTSTINFSIDAASAKPISFLYSTVPNTALAGKDFVFASGQVDIAPGQTSASIAVETINDNLDEEDKFLLVEISSLENVDSELTELGLTILDDDNAPILSSVANNVVEGDDVSVEFSLSSASEKAITFDVLSSSSDATAGSDYVSLSQTVTINAGETSKTISLSTIDDSTDEADEAIGISISNLVNATTTSESFNFSIIDNDDAPTISFAGTSVGEGAGTATISFAISAVSEKVISFDVATEENTATNADFTSLTKTLTIDSGETSVTQSFEITQDESDEANESFNVVISNLTNVSASNTSASIGIIDDDGAPTIYFNDASVNEGSSLTIPVLLSNTSELPITVNYATVDGTASSGKDYTSNSGQLTFAPGESSKSITLETIDNELDEDNRGLTVRFDNPSNAELSFTTLNVLLLDEDEAPVVSAFSSSVTEGQPLTVSFTLSAESGKNVTFEYATSNGDAIAGQDYSSKSGLVTIAAGDQIATVSIDSLEDLIDEDSEAFNLILSNVSGATLKSTSVNLVLNDNNDAPEVSILDTTVSEGAGSAEVQVKLDAASGKTITVDYSASASGNGSAITDFIPTSGQLTFAPGQTEKTISITILDDNIKESDESFSVGLGRLTNATSSANNFSASVLIEDDDLPPTASITGSSALEDFGSVQAIIELTSPSAQTISVDFRTSDSLAIDGLDYQGVSETVTFEPGQTRKIIEVPLLGDTLDENDEVISADILNPFNTTITSSSANLIIEDSDAAPTISVFNPLSVNEGDNAVYTINLSNISAKDISFNYQIDGVSSADVDETSGSVLIPAGSATATISVATLEDNFIEPTEVINLSFNSAQNVQIGSSSYKTQLINTTFAGISVADTSVDEVSSSASVVVSLSATPVSSVEVDYRTTNSGSASVLVDYAPVSGTLIFAAGETSKTVSVSIIDDSLDEEDETIGFALSTPVNGVIADGSATIQIIDNDITSIVFNSGRFDESSDPQIQVSLTSSASEAISVDYQFVGRTATAGEDFVASSGTLNFSSGQSTVTIPLDIIDDSVRENDELITLTLSNPVNATLPSSSETITILDNDVDQAASIKVSQATEGEQAQITVSLGNAPEVEAEYQYYTRGSSADDSDFNNISGNITFKPGETSKTIFIDLIDDDIKEASEVFEFVLTHSVLGEQVQEVQVRDNDSLNIAVLDGAADESAQNGQVEINLSNPSSTTTEVTYQVIDKTSGQVVDESVVNIEAGLTSGFINIPIEDDELDEYDQEFEIILVSSNADYIDDGTAKFVVYDNDVTPTVTASSIDVGENDGEVSVKLSLSEPSGRSILVSYSTESGTAIDGEDFYGSTGTFTYNPGDVEKVVTLQIVDNSLDEPNKAFSLNIGNLENAIAGANANINIQDDDEPPVVSVASNISVSENVGTVELTFELDRVSTSDISISLSAEADSAQNSDYALDTNTLVINAGETNGTVSFSINNDLVDESDEVFNIRYSNVTNATIDQELTQVEIIDDDFAPSIFVDSELSITEGQSGSVLVSVTSPSSQRIEVNYEIRDGPTNPASRNVDYSDLNGTLVFEPGETSKTLNLVTIDDTRDEFDEIIQFVLLNPVNAELSNATNTISVVDNDLPANVTANDLTVSEGDGSIGVLISLDNPSDKDITISYQTISDTATESDFFASSGFITFEAGEVEKVIPLFITEDDIFEGTEAFNLEISNAQNAVITKASSIISITDNDLESDFIVITPSFVREGELLAIEIILTSPLQNDVKISYDIIEMSSDGQNNVFPPVGLINIPAGDTFELLLLDVLDDKIIEPNSEIFIEFGSSGNFGLRDKREGSLIIIEDNDSGPIFSNNSLSFEVSENTTRVGDIFATDVDGDSLSYSISGANANKFIYSAGGLEFIAAPNYEFDNTRDYSLTLTATDGFNEDSIDISISVIDANDAPVFADTGYDFAIDENTTAITTIVTSDEDTSAFISETQLSLSGTDADSFSINQAGVLTLNEAADFESGKTSYEVTLIANDGTASTNQAVIVTVNDLNDEAPVFKDDENYTISIEENTSVELGFPVFTSDADADSTVTFSLSGADAASFNVDESLSADGIAVIRFNTLTDFEIKTSYAVTVTADDGANTTDQALVFNVLDLNDEAPVFTSESDITIDEGATEIVTLATTDADADSTVAYTLSGDDAESFALSEEGILTLQTEANFEAKTSYAITITANDGVNTTVQAITVSVNDLNDNAPVFADVNYDISIVENTKGPTLLETTDADAGSTVAYSLSGADVADFEIVNNTLALKEAADFESGKTAYAVTVTASDGENTATQAVTYTITDANDNAPVFTSSAAVSIVENTKGPTLLETTDADAGSTVAYSLSGADVADFEIVNNTLALKEAADFETKSSYAVTVTASDGENTATQAVTYTITDANDNAPVFTSSAAVSIVENTNEVVTLATTDADANSTVTYSITGGFNGPDFVIYPSGVLAFRTGVEPDFELIGGYTYEVIVTADDGLNETSQTILVDIINIEESTFIDIQGVAGGEISIPEDDNNTLRYIAFVEVFDDDFYAPVSARNERIKIEGADRDKFAFDPSGSLYLLENDYETQNIFDITLRYTSPEFNKVVTRDLKVLLEDINDNAPVFTSSATVTIDENTTAVTTLETTDADTNPTVSYSITGGADADDFEVSTTGALALKDKPDFESGKTSYAVTVSASDGTNTTNQAITVTIEDTNDNAPVFKAGTSFFNIDEGGISSGLIEVVATDSDSSQAFSQITYAIENSGDSNKFKINSLTGSIEFLAPSDYEQQPTYVIVVSATDGLNTSTQQVQISLNNINDNLPIFLSNSSFETLENKGSISTPSSETIEAIISASDADGDQISFSISGGVDADRFRIQPNSVNNLPNSVILRFNNFEPNYEQKSVFNITVSAYDGERFTDQNITINVLDVNETPSWNYEPNRVMYEGSTDVIAIINAIDEDANSVLTYKLLATAPSGAVADTGFVINEQTGELRPTSPFDYETDKKSFSVFLEVSDGTNSRFGGVYLNLRDINDEPPIFNDLVYDLDIFENTIGSSVALSLESTDADADSTVSYSIASGLDANSFEIINDKLTLTDLPDFESGKNLYEVVVTANDGVNSTNQKVTYTIIDVNDNAPVFTSNA